MPIQVQTSLMTGGLDLVTPPIAMQPGKVIASLNYEPDLGGYSSTLGYERFDGHLRPSDTFDQKLVRERRKAIGKVPGQGPVRGVWVFDGDVYAFRDSLDGISAGMFRATPGGWQTLDFGLILEFGSATHEFLVGEYVSGNGPGGGVGVIDRVVLREGAWDGSGSGFLIISNMVGTFTSGETISSGSGGEATGLGTKTVDMLAGGRYDFTNHNFYGAAERARMYFVSGTSTAFEWTGSILTPIITGQSAGTGFSFTTLAHPGGYSGTYPGGTVIDEGPLLAANGDTIVLTALSDAPAYITHFKNHLFLGYTAGTLLNSSLGEPLEYTTITGAGEISFGDQITGLLTAASTSMMIFAQNRIEYLVGTDSTTFQSQPVSESSGAQPYTAQLMDQPVYLDDGGLRTLSATASFGDWRMGTMTQPVEKLIRQKRDTGVVPVASVRVKAKDQYKLFFSDQTGITVYIGRKYPETLPFKLPCQVFCCCAGEVDIGAGDRQFIGCEDGYVYELNRGTSFDGLPIESYIRLPFNAAGSPQQNTRWTKVSFEIETPDDITMGVAFDTDYGRGDRGERSDVPVGQGAAIVTTSDYASVDWTQPVEGRLEYHLNGYGPNIAATLIHSATDKRQHTISSQTYNFSRRRMKR